MSDWMDAAACKGLHAGEMFPRRGENGKLARARTICASCPVTTECLEQALENVEHHGVWGGLTEKERRALRRERGVACGECGRVVARTGAQTYCSGECRAAADRRTHADWQRKNRVRKSDAKPCRWCGEPSPSKKGGGFCGWQCEAAHKRAETRRLMEAS